ncbi:hypothetical protein Syun_007758 [Stephania yunnanensis]|uniref:Pentatricopeptide repeat-containing protein n=1 Tax=Stephania yunnanensis TaxID=152371 RepID=A0AAP0L0R3_9MAGN
MLISSVSRSLARFSSKSSPSPSNPNPRSVPRKANQSVRRIVRLLSPSRSPNLSEALETLEYSPQEFSTQQASALVSAIGNPLISFDFYRFLKSQTPIFRPDSVLYASLIKSQVQSVNPHIPRIRFYLDEMRKRKVAMSKEDFEGLFELGVSKSVEIGGFLVGEVLEKSEFQESFYNWAISVYGKHGFCEEGLMVAERARARSERLSSGFYECVMGVYSVNGDARGAMELFFEMDERGVIASEGIYGVLLGILCRAGWAKLCFVVLEEMKRLGFRPDERLTMDLIQLFVKQNMGSEVKYFVEEGIVKDTSSLALSVRPMAEEESNVDGSVYASLILGCGKSGLIEEAERIFSEFKSLECVKNAKSAYASMVYVYSRAEMRRMAEKVFQEMEVKTDSTGRTDVFLHMIAMYATLGLFDDMVKMFEELVKKCGASVEAYAILIGAFTKSGKRFAVRDEKLWSLS